MKIKDYILLTKHSIHIQTKNYYIIKFDKYIIEINNKFIHSLDIKPIKENIDNLLHTEFFRSNYITPIFKQIYKIKYPCNDKTIYNTAEICIEFETYKQNLIRTYNPSDKIRIKLKQ